MNEIKDLAAKLDLPYEDGMQDWEIQVANSKRVTDFLERAERLTLTVFQRITLLELILTSYNRFLAEANERSSTIEARIVHYVKELDPKIPVHLKDYYIMLVDMWKDEARPISTFVGSFFPLT